MINLLLITGFAVVIFAMISRVLFYFKKEDPKDISVTSDSDIARSLRSLSKSNSNFSELISRINSKYALDEKNKDSGVFGATTKIYAVHFSIDSLKLTGVSNSFSELMNGTFEDILERYHDMISGGFLGKREERDDVFIFDVFNFNSSIRSSLTHSAEWSSDILAEKNKFKIVGENVIARLNLEIMDCAVNVVCDILADSQSIVVVFDIHDIQNFSSCVKKIVGSDDALVMRNFAVDITYPLFIIDRDGMRFRNKCACDWFGISYDKNSANNSMVTQDRIFDFLDNTLYSAIQETIEDSSSTGFYREYNVEGADENIPSTVLVHVIPFMSGNKREAVVTFHNAIAAHSFEISKNDDQESREVSEYIRRISSANSVFRSFFGGTQMVSFGRIDVNTKHVLACNDSFVDILKYDSNSERYVSIIESVVSEHSIKNISPVNFYVYHINYSDRETTLVYSYSDSYVDIVFIEKSAYSFLSNDSLNHLANLHETSDLPIAIVNRNGIIFGCNSAFRSFFSQEQITGESSFLDLVPSQDKNKVKRAIGDAIKFNSCNLEGVVAFRCVNGFDKNCRLTCIKTYTRINDEEFVTITIFPQRGDSE